MNELLWAIIACGAVSIIYAVITIQQVMAADAGNEKMQEIATAIREGAQAYLNRQYITIARAMDKILPQIAEIPRSRQKIMFQVNLDNYPGIKFEKNSTVSLHT